MTRARILAEWQMHFVVFRGLSSSKLLVRYMLVFSYCNIYSPIFTPRVTCIVQLPARKIFHWLYGILETDNKNQVTLQSCRILPFHIPLQLPRISLSFSFPFTRCLRALIPCFQRGFTGTLKAVVLPRDYDTQLPQCLSTLGPNDLKIGHLGQVCTFYTFSYQTLYTALVRCLDHFQSKKMSKYHIVRSYLMTSQKRGIQIF